MSTSWLLFASLSVLGSLIYNVSMKIGSSSMNPFLFAFILTLTALIIQTVACGVSRYGFKIDITQQITTQNILCAMVAGFAAALVDISYFFALRHGSTISCQTFWTIGGILALTIFSILYFHEALTISKAAGIALGIVSLFLIVR
jgi:uncharacterized membrane protein